MTITKWKFEKERFPPVHISSMEPGDMMLVTDLGNERKARNRLNHFQRVGSLHGRVVRILTIRKIPKSVGFGAPGDVLLFCSNRGPYTDPATEEVMNGAAHALPEDLKPPADWEFLGRGPRPEFDYIAFMEGLDPFEAKELPVIANMRAETFAMHLNRARNAASTVGKRLGIKIGSQTDKRTGSVMFIHLGAR